MLDLDAEVPQPRCRTSRSLLPYGEQRGELAGGTGQEAFRREVGAGVYHHAQGVAGASQAGRELRIVGAGGADAGLLA